MHASGAIFDQQGRILLVREANRYQDWDLPGGGILPEEAPWDAAVREVHEECGIIVVPTAILGAFLSRIEPGKGLNVVWICEWIDGKLQPQAGEIAEIGWFSEGTLPTPILPARLPVILSALRGERGVYRTLE